jgi:predicted nucleotidyltransferase
MNAAVENDIQRNRALVAALCRRHGARRLDLFGSATRGDFDAQRSDLDFLVEFEDLEPAQYAQAYFALKEGLEHIFQRPVDLVTENNLGNPYFRQRVQSERQNLYAR